MVLRTCCLIYMVAECPGWSNPALLHAPAYTVQISVVFVTENQGLLLIHTRTTTPFPWHLGMGTRWMGLGSSQGLKLDETFFEWKHPL